MTFMDLREAAEQLGVHYMTAYGWVRSGRLRAVKRGRTYHVSSVDLERLIEARQRPLPPPRRRVGRWDSHVEVMSRRLVAGDEAGARRLLERISAGGTSVQQLCDDLLAPVLRDIGAEWAAGRLSVAEEHRAAAICERLLAPMSGQPRGRPRGTVVVLTSPGDQHAMPALMATAALREQRWRVEHLGVNVPTEDLLALLSTVQPDAVVMSLAYPPAEAQAADLARTLEGAGVPTVVGRPHATLSELYVQLNDRLGRRT